MRALLVTGVLLAAALGGALSSCVGAGGTACDGPCTCPSQAVFTGQSPDGGAIAAGSVSTYMERRCGTLDCHGSEARPMRLYGRFGLRNPDGTDISGGKSTTSTELADNYSAVCSVQPEETDSAVQDQGVSAEQLLIVEKMRGLESHKGGQVVTQGSPGDNCVAGWLRGDPADMVASACQTAIAGL